MSKALMVKYSALTLLLLVTVVCVFFMVFNAEWVIGDDSIIMAVIGFGDYFTLHSTVWPEVGRFFPTAYLMYNPLAFVCNNLHGLVSATDIYVYQSIFFIFMVITAVTFFLKVQEEKTIYSFLISILACLVVVGRTCDMFVNCFCTGWFWDSIMFLQCIFLYKFLDDKKTVCGILYLIISLYFLFGSERVFIAPLSLGVCGLIFCRNKNELQDKIFFSILVINAILFLILYYFIVYIHIEKVYDSAHGSELGYIQNAFNIIFAQKIFWLAIPLFLFRLWKVVFKGDECVFVDLLLFMSAAQCCGNFILKLNATLYYSSIAVQCLPAIIYWSNKYLNGKVTCMIFVMLALFYSPKIPYRILDSQNARLESRKYINAIVGCMENQQVFFYNPTKNLTDFESEMNAWHFATLRTYLAYELRDKNLKIDSKENFDEAKGIWVTIDANEQIIPNCNEVIENNCSEFAYHRGRGFRAWQY